MAAKMAVEDGGHDGRQKFESNVSQLCFQIKKTNEVSFNVKQRTRSPINYLEINIDICIFSKMAGSLFCQQILIESYVTVCLP